MMELADDAALEIRNEIRIETGKPRPHTLKAELHHRAGAVRGMSAHRPVSHDSPGSFAQARLVHRDVKPSNIIFVHGVPKLADIGLVTDLDATMSFGDRRVFAAGRARVCQADIYSLGKCFTKWRRKGSPRFSRATTNLERCRIASRWWSLMR